MHRTLAAVVAALSLLVTTEAQAAFHLNLIDEVKSGVGGDPSVQYVEVRVLSEQNIVGNTRLTAFNCDGSSSTVLLVVPNDIANSGAGARFLMATTNFAAAAGINPDFTWNPATAGSIPTTCGMVCWGAPGFAPPSPGSWDPADPNQYVDCLAFGPYTGPKKTSTHNSTPTSGTPTTLTTGEALMSLTRGTTTGNNIADFNLACPTPTNNSGSTGSFGQCPPPTTSSTTQPPTTTTSSTTTTSTTTLPTTTTAPETTTTTSSTATTSTSTTTLETTTTTSTTVATTSTTTITETTTTTSSSSTSSTVPTTTTSTTPTTSTTLVPVCGNGILEPGEECDPPWSRKADQCPPTGGHRYGPECGDDCRCVTGATTSSTTSTSTTTTTTTTTPVPQDIQCCITRSPEPAFPEGVTCEFLKPAECEAFDGVNLGPGSCDPNPCVSTTTTTLSGLAASCTRSATMASVKCRLARLAALVSEAGDMHGLGEKLLQPLQRAEAHVSRAEQLHALGQSRRARAFVRRAVHDLKIVAKKLRSRRAARLLSPASRDAMLALVQPLPLDLQALVAPGGR